MFSTMEVCGALVFMCIVCTWAAPVEQELSKTKTNSNVPTVRDQEKQLEYLASLAGSRPKNVNVEKVQTFKFSNVNGKEKGIKETKSKVNGELLSDIKEKFKQDTLSGKPAKVTTEIDLPKAGVHKVLNTDTGDVIDNVQLQGDKTQNLDNSFDLNPNDIAAYLFQADEDEFTAFDKMLQGLVNSSIMTTAQASEYKDEVRQAFNRLVMEAAEAETEQMAAESFPENFDNSVDEDVYDLLGYQDFQNPSVDIGPFSKTPMDTPFTGEETLTSLIKNAMDEWLTNAIVTGDHDAEALLTNILNEVAKDDNPDDLGQMREMLMDFFTNEVLNSMVPRDQIEDFPAFGNTDNLPALPKDQIITDSELTENDSDSKESTENKDAQKEEGVKGSDKSSSVEQDKNTSEKQPTEEEKEKLKM